MINWQLINRVLLGKKSSTLFLYEVLWYIALGLDLKLTRIGPQASRLFRASKVTVVTAAATNSAS